MFESIKHNSKKRYYSQKIVQCKDNAKQIWNVVERLTDKTRKLEPHLPGKLLIDEQEVSGKEETTNEFNTFFTNIGPQSAKKTPNASRPFENYFKKRHNHANRLS